MVAAVYELKVDTRRTGTYAAAADDLTSRLIGQATFGEGMNSAYQDFAQPARATFQLDNSDGAFNQNVDSTYSPSVTVTGPFFFSSLGAVVSNAIATVTIGKTYKVEFTSTMVYPSIPNLGYLGVYDGSTRVGPSIHGYADHVYTHGDTAQTYYVNAETTTLYLKSTGKCDFYVAQVTVTEVTKYGNLMLEGTIARLRMTVNSTTKTLYEGRIDSLDLSAGSTSRRVATLTLSDPMLDLLDTEATIPLYTNITPDTAISNILDLAVIPLPYIDSYWMLGIEGASELGETTYIFSKGSPELGAGSTTYNYVGDNTIGDGKAVSVQTLLRDIVAGEIYGRFFWKSSIANFCFQARSLDFNNWNTSIFTMTDADYEVDASVYTRAHVTNKSFVTYQPRKVGTPATVLWSADDVPFTMGATKKKIVARFRDVNNESARVGATDVIAPVANTDYTIVMAGGTGGDVSASVGVSALIGANSAEITIDNTNNSFAIRVTSLQIRGTPLTTFDPRTLESEMELSQRDLKVAPERLNYRLIDTENVAQSVVDYVARKNNYPTFVFDKVTFIANKASNRFDFILNGDIGDTVTVTNGWLGYSKIHGITGIKHTITWGGDHTHQVTFQLRPSTFDHAWILGTSLLDVDTILVF